MLQYPLSQLFPALVSESQYEWSDWLVAYSFVLISITIFISAIVIGMNGRLVKIFPAIEARLAPTKRLELPFALFVFGLFGLWSYLMVNLKIGMTIYTDFAPLPFRLTGFLFYGRLFVQPLFLAYIALGYRNSRMKWIIYFLLITLGAWVAMSSGSRFASILFALPIVMLFKGNARYIAFGIPLLAYIIIASLSRSFYLPMVIGDVDIIRIYANELMQESAVENILLQPFEYIVTRPMGISEVLMTLKFGQITPSFMDSLQVFISYFVPFVPSGISVSVKNIYGYEDDFTGGLGLDLFSNYWVMFGGNPLLYIIGLSLIGWILGKTYRLFAIGMRRFEFNDFYMLLFILLFLLIIEGRGYLFPTLLALGWLFSKKITPRIVFGILGLFVRRKL